MITIKIFVKFVTVEIEGNIYGLYISFNGNLHIIYL